MRLPLVLAANVETLIGVAFVVISLISGLLNYMNARAKPNGPNRGGAGGRPVRPRSERIQSEIEQFMREQVRRQEGDAPPRPQPEARPQPEPRPAPAKPLPQRRPAPQRGPAPRPASRRAAEPRKPIPRQPIGQSEQSSPTARPGDDISHRKSVASEGLGQGLREHLKSAMVERVQSEAQAHLAHSVSGDATKHLGAFTGGLGPSPAEAAPTNAAAVMASELRSREGLRRALIAQIVLERPAALRRNR